MNVHVVTCISTFGGEPIVTVWDNKEAAKKHFDYERKKQWVYKRVDIDYDVPVYQLFATNGTESIMWRKP